MKKLNKKTKLIIIILSILIVLFIAYFYYYLNKTYNFIIPCIIKKITGLYCPGCGITRMIFSLIKLDFYQAFRYNPLLFFLLPIILIFLIDFLIKWYKNKQNYLINKISKYNWITLLIIVLVYTVLRNIPLFSFLLPTVL